MLNWPHKLPHCRQWALAACAASTGRERRVTSQGLDEASENGQAPGCYHVNGAKTCTSATGTPSIPALVFQEIRAQRLQSAIDGLLAELVDERRSPCSLYIVDRVCTCQRTNSTICLVLGACNNADRAPDIPAKRRC
eukprot:1976405-Amphidinium_carterae.1